MLAGNQNKLALGRNVMFTLRTLVAVGLVLVLAAGAHAENKGRMGVQRGGQKVQKAREAGSARATGERAIGPKNPRGDKFRVQKAASNGPTIVPTSTSALKAKAPAGALKGDPDQPLGAFTDDNSSPSELGLSVKGRSGSSALGRKTAPSIVGQEPMPRR
jgi:hypothetical protein